MIKVVHQDLKGSEGHMEHEDKNPQAIYQDQFGPISQNKSILTATSRVSATILLIGVFATVIGVLYLVLYIVEPSVVQNKRIFPSDLIVTREQWHAQAPTAAGTKLNLPVEIVIISETTTSACNETENCGRIVQSIQSSHMKVRHWDDIGYNFLVGGDGKIYEGRGWNIQGAHTKGFNQNSVGISLIGIYDDLEPKRSQLEVIKRLLDDGVRLHKLSKNYYLYGPNEVRDKFFRDKVINNINKGYSDKDGLKCYMS